MSSKTAMVWDLDNVAYPFQEAWSLIAVSKGLITPRQAPVFPTLWSFYKTLGLTGEQFAQTLVDWIPDGVSDLLPPYPDMALAWREIAGMGVDTYAITARPAEARAVTAHWLSRWQLPVKELHVVQGSKVPHLPLDQGYDRVFAIDDNIDTVREYAAVEDDTLVPLRRVQPWNMARSIEPTVIDIHSGSDLKHLVALAEMRA